jgi:hypothetical protein
MFLTRGSINLFFLLGDQTFDFALIVLLFLAQLLPEAIVSF